MNKWISLYFVGFILLLSNRGFAQNRAFLNGGFEFPPFTNANEYQYFISQNAPTGTPGIKVEEWNTTATDYRIEYRRLLGGSGEPSAVGNQHAEINAAQAFRRLYQNVCVIQGETIGYSYYHRGRNGLDIMEVNLYNAIGTTKMVTLKASTTNNISWQQYSDVYNVLIPTGTYQFSFESINTSGSDDDEGNLLDEISVTMAPLVTFSKATYTSAENAVEIPVIKVNGTVPAGGLDIVIGATSLSAKEGVDFTVTKTMNVPAGSYNLDLDFPLTFAVLNDAFKEYKEEIQLTIQSVTNGAIINAGCGGSVNATYTIVDDDPFEAGPDQEVCPGELVTVHATGGQAIRWNKGVKQDIPFKAPLVAGDYMYTAYDSINTNYANNLLMNSDFSGGNTGFTIDPRYVYNPNFDPTFSTFYLTTNEYTILPNPRMTNPNFYNMTDHSGTNPSSMLIVDGFAFPDVSFWLQTIPVIPNTDYRLSAWFASVGAGTPADIQFYVNGNAAGPPLPIPDNGSWVNYGYTWNSGANTTAVIRAVDLNTVSVDNDFAMDDVYFGPIEVFKDSLKVTVKSVPQPVTFEIDTCQQPINYTLIATGTSLKWYNDTLATTVGSTTTPVIDFSLPDTLSKWVTQVVNGCESPKAELKIRVRKAPSASITKDTVMCQQTGLLTLTAVGTNLKWYDTQTSVPVIATPGFDTDIPVNTSRWVSPSLNGCDGVRKELKVLIKALPAAPSTKYVDTCQQPGNHTLIASGTSLLWYDALTGGVGSAIVPVLDLNIPDTTTKWVSQTVNGCEGPRQELQVQIKAIPTAPLVQDIDTCKQAGNLTLTAIGNNLLWYSSNTGGIGTSIAPMLDLDVNTSKSYWVSQTVDLCEGPRSEVQVQIQASTITPVTKNLDTCQTSGTYQLKASGTNLRWYDAETGGIATTTTPDFDLSVPISTSKWVSQIVNNTCEGPRIKIDAQIRILPSAPLTKDLDTCQSADNYPLLATGTNLTWYDVATAGTGNNTIPIYDLNIPITTSKWVSQTIACEGPRTELRVRIRPLPTAPTIKNLDTCQVIGTYTPIVSGSNLLWYDAQTGGLGTTSTPTYDLNIPLNSRIWVSQSSAGCEGPRNQILLRIKEIPSAPIARDTTLCQQAGDISLIATGTALTWYDAAVAGNVITPPSFPTTVPITTTLWASQTVNSCEGPRSSLTLSIKALPTAPLTKDTSLCQKAGTMTFEATGTNLLWYPSGATIGQTTTPSVITDLSQTTTFSVSQTVNGCEGPKSVAFIEIRQIPLAPTKIDQVLCESTGTISYIVTGNVLKWYSSPTGAAFSTTTPSINRNNVGSHQIYVSQTLNNCESPRTIVRVVIHPIPLAPDIPNVAYCIKDIALPLTDRTDSLFWYTLALGGVKSLSSPTPSTQAVGVENHWVAAVEKGCEGPRTMVSATINALPVVKITGTSSGSFCAKSTLLLNANGATQYDWTQPSGDHFMQANLIVSSFSSVDVGKYLLIGTDANQCSAKDSVVLSLKNPPPVSADPVAVCEKAPILIQANTLGSAYWKLPGNRIQNSSRLYLSISSYSDHGRYVVVSTQNGCTDSSEVFVSVSNCAPTAKDDYYSINADEILKVTATNHSILNDTDPNDKLLLQDFTVITPPRYGQLNLEASGFWTYKVTAEVDALEILEYRVCDTGVPILCTTAKIEIQINKRGAFLPDAFTPNGDGINDMYTVYYLSPQVKVALNVFNRWGDLVYENKDYKNDWRGTCSQLNCSNSDLPVGTYYIVAELSNGAKHTTYLTLSR